MEEKYNFLKNKTNNIPYLLHVGSMIASCENWIEQTEEALKPIIQDYVTQTFELLEEIDIRQFTCNLTPYFLWHSINGARVPMNYLSLFLMNFLI